MMEKSRLWARAGLASFIALALMPASDAAAPPAVSTPIVTLAARQVGVKQCLPAISAIAQRATAGATMQDIILSWDKQAPDSSPFFSMTGMGNATQKAALTIVAVPAAGGQCSVLVERISSGAGDCVVAAHEFPGMPNAKLIEGIMVYQNPKNADETFTLIQNAGNCIVIRRQAMFKWGQKP